MTTEQIRAEVEAAKIKAAKRYDRDMGEGAFDALREYRAKHNAAALDDICNAA